MKNRNFKTMKNKELKAYLLSQGFEYEGGDEHLDMYSMDTHISVAIYKNGKTRDLTFAYSGDGCYEILNATAEQIKLVLVIFKAAKHSSEKEQAISYYGFKVAELFQQCVQELMKKSNF